MKTIWSYRYTNILEVMKEILLTGLLKVTKITLPFSEAKPATDLALNINELTPIFDSVRGHSLSTVKCYFTS